ncbi:hypothetical protein LZ30DRAFT_713591 [Colletotrichum cereale]|nr:hypothetical protein LZ30DRAFT_713591 [Colletotrichum cereale]
MTHPPPLQSSQETGSSKLSLSFQLRESGATMRGPLQHERKDLFPLSIHPPFERHYKHELGPCDSFTTLSMLHAPSRTHPSFSKIPRWTSWTSFSRRGCSLHPCRAFDRPWWGKFGINTTRGNGQWQNRDGGTGGEWGEEKIQPIHPKAKAVISLRPPLLRSDLNGLNSGFYLLDSSDAALLDTQPSSSSRICKHRIIPTCSPSSSFIAILLVLFFCLTISRLCYPSN